MKFAISIDAFLSGLNWIDGKPLKVEPYRLDIFRRVFNERRSDGGLRYTMVVSGRAKKNNKTTDLILAALYCLLWADAPQGNDCLLVANDESQSGDDLDLARKIVAANPTIARYLDPLLKEIRRIDGRGVMRVVASNNIAGQHGKTSIFTGWDEIHGFENWDLFEALAPDPTRYCLQWVTSYDSILDIDGAPLHDLKTIGKAGTDERMLFSWYSAEFCTDPAFAALPPDQRANPSMGSWPDGAGYLAQQRRRLPSAKFRRLHWNLPGAPQGTFFDQSKVEAAIIAGRDKLDPQPGIEYLAAVDMSGGSSDDAVLAISNWDDVRKVAVLDFLVDQDQPTPFNPRLAVARFAVLAKRYGCKQVHGDAYAGQTFRHDFSDCGLEYVVTDKSASDFYEDLEVALNAGQAELLDQPKLKRQLLTLIRKGASVTHPSGQHDDHANAAAIALVLANPDLGAEYPHRGIFEHYRKMAEAATRPAVKREPDTVKVVVTTGATHLIGGVTGNTYQVEIDGDQRVAWISTDDARHMLGPFADQAFHAANRELMQRLGKPPHSPGVRIVDLVDFYEPEVTVDGWISPAAMCRNTFRMMGRL